MESVCLDSIRRYFGKCRRYELLYRKRVELNKINGVMKVTGHRYKSYKSHRRVFDTKIMKEAGVELTTEELQGLCFCSTCYTVKDGEIDDKCSYKFCQAHGTEKWSTPFQK